MRGSKRVGKGREVPGGQPCPQQRGQFMQTKGGRKLQRFLQEVKSTEHQIYLDIFFFEFFLNLFFFLDILRRA